MRGWYQGAASAVLLFSSLCTAAWGQRELTFEQRVDAQEAIEHVYHSWRIGSTRPFEQAVPREVLERKVRRYLKQTVALERFWKTRVTAEALDRELERIARNTQSPASLRELYRALEILAAGGLEAGGVIGQVDSRRDAAGNQDGNEDNAHGPAG